MFGELLWVVRDNGLTRSDTGGTTVVTSSAISVVLAYYIDILINRFWLRTSDGKTDNQMYMTWDKGQIAPIYVTVGSYNEPRQHSVVLNRIQQS